MSTAIARRVPRVAFDARDAGVPMPHGSGIYVRHLLAAIERADPPDLALAPIRRRPPGPEVGFEQLALPALLTARGANLLHGPDSFIPLVRPCPAVVTVHDLAFLAIPGDMPARTERKYRALVPRCARSAQRVIVPSQFTADDVERRCGVPRDRIRVIGEGPALPLGTREPPAGRYLIAAGDLRPKKNLGVLVQAFARLHREGLPHELILAGADCGSGDALHRLAGASPVRQTGFVDDPMLDALIRGAEALVVPGPYEGFGLVALDAMARGIPVVLARAGALPEVGGDAASYFEPGDVDELAAVLRPLLAYPHERRRRSAAALERSAHFSWDAAAAATLDVYRELL